MSILQNLRTGFIDTYDFDPDGRMLRDAATWGARQILGEGTAFGFIPFGGNSYIRPR